ncbi:MAG: substrate-binding domain-containing protein [Clostridia bacterium]
MKVKKILGLGLVTAMIAAAASGCTTSSETSGSSTASNGADSSAFKADRAITVVSREDGSGTRGAFIELFGIEEKDANGNKTDKTTTEAIIANKTDVMLTNVAGDEYAIGYVSLGSLSSSVKAVKIDGTEATPENVKNGTYKIARPFNIATKAEISDTAKDFIDFILSREGQEVVTNGYIPVNDSAQAYSGSKPAGKIVVAGSSSVSPIMEKLKEAYLAVNTNAEIEIQTSDSTSGMNGAIEGTCDIGMASRDLKDSELAELTPTAIALDGIAVIVNNQNPIANLTSDSVKTIFTGEVTSWSEAE